MTTLRMVLVLFALMTTALCASANDPIASVVENAKPAIVTIITYDAKGKAVGQGAGFLVDPGHVITCYNVIDGAAKTNIKMASGKTYLVKGIDASDRIADIARLTLASPVKDAKFLSLSKTLPKQGEKVAVVGTPVGLELAVSDGVVSVIHEIPGVSKIIQITAPDSPSSSGSPVLDLNGNVIGVVTSYSTEEKNLNFAVASEQVLSLKSSSSSALPGASQNGKYKEFLKELKAGFGYMLQENYSKALPHFEMATRLVPNEFTAWYGRGYCCCNLKRYPEAIDAYKKAIQINPSYAEAHCNLGVSYGYLDQFSNAVDAYKHAVQINPDYALAQYNLGYAYYSLDRYQDASDAFKQAIRVDPNNYEAHCNLGITYNQLDRFSDAVDAFNQAIRIKPDYAEAYFSLGSAYCSLHRYTDELDALKQAIRIKPDFAEAHYSLGIEYLNLGYKEKALEEHKFLKSLDTKFADDLFEFINK